jgi:hypothetical protein
MVTPKGFGGLRLVALLILLASGCGGSGGGSTPTIPTTPSTPTTPVVTTRTVPIFLNAWSCSACPQPKIAAALQGTVLTSGYNVLHLEPGTYELTGTLLPSDRAELDDRDRWDISFTTFPQLGSPPFINDNGVDVASILSTTGPSVSYNRPECSVFYHVPDKSFPQFRIQFTVTASRAAGVTCPARFQQ